MTADSSPAEQPGGEPSPGLSTADLATAGQSAPTTNGQTPGAEKQDSSTSRNAPLFNDDESQNFRTRWNAIQTSFVDDPRQGVQQADELVAQTIQRIAQIFSGERTELENQWGSGKDVSKEELRLALQRYRSFFDRLLSV